MGSNGVNKVILIGNLGSDPDLRYVQNGTAVCELRLATNETWKDKEGQKQERVEWHRIVCWSKLGERCGKYLNKGSMVYVEGSLRTREWQDKNDVKRYTTEVVARDVNFLANWGNDGQREKQHVEDSGQDYQQDQESLPF